MEAAVQTASFEFGIKAVEVREDDSGDLIIEGYASDFQTDRDLEAFEPESFERGLKAYLESNPILLYHHSPDKQLGVVEEGQLDGKGLKIKARIPKPPEGSWATHVYNLVRRGMMRGFSVGGAFKRHLTPTGPRIFDVDLQEISVTPLPVNPRTLFGVAGKAFAEAGEADELADVKAQLEQLETVLNTLERALD